MGEGERLCEALLPLSLFRTILPSPPLSKSYHGGLGGGREEDGRDGGGGGGGEAASFSPPPPLSHAFTVFIAQVSTNLFLWYLLRLKRALICESCFLASHLCVSSASN